MMHIDRQTEQENGQPTCAVEQNEHLRRRHTVMCRSIGYANFSPESITVDSLAATTRYL
jgi:hypothetical protein